MSAAAFAKGLLDLEGQLTPILVCFSFMNKIFDLVLCVGFSLTEILSQVSLVSKDSSMLDGLDNASIEMDEAKVCDFMMTYSPFSTIKALR